MGTENKPTQAETDVSIRDRIKHLLTVYPVISPTMLQAGLGPQTKPDVWRPILQELVEEGDIKEETLQTMTPYGRYHGYTRLKLRTDDNNNRVN